MRTDGPSQQRLIRLGVLLALAGVTGVALVAVGTRHPDDTPLLPRCQLHSLTGLHCPGCGLTRSLHSLLNGDVSQAFAYNALFAIAFPVLGLSLGRSFWAWAWGRPQRLRTRLSPWTPYLLGSFLIAFGVLRNVPRVPFTTLAPHELEAREPTTGPPGMSDRRPRPAAKPGDDFPQPDAENCPPAPDCHEPRP